MAALDLPSSPASRRDPSTEERDRGFLNPTKWYVHFEDAREVGRWINGLIYSHPSRWMTIRDEEGDILAGRHLNIDEELDIGKRLKIDFFHIEVLECVQVPMECKEQTVVVDLTEDDDGPKPSQRFGGRFWILADDDEDDEDLPEPTVRPPSTSGLVTSIPVTKPVVSCKKSLSLGTPVPSQKSKVKPWSGPLPKEGPPAITLSDFFRPEC